MSLLSSHYSKPAVVNDKQGNVSVNTELNIDMKRHTIQISTKEALRDGSNAYFKFTKYGQIEVLIKKLQEMHVNMLQTKS